MGTRVGAAVIPKALWIELLALGNYVDARAGCNSRSALQGSHAIAPSQLRCQLKKEFPYQTLFRYQLVHQ